jgi:lipoprotein-anchoring transpeptidase ErfK/SrfK
MVVLSGPGRSSPRRGVTTAGATLPIYGAHAGAGCGGPWWLIGPLSWVCSDDALLAPDDPITAPPPVEVDGLPRQYFFLGHDGASAYASLESAGEGTPDRELEGGWAVAVVEQRSWAGQRWARTSKGLWIAVRDLSPAHITAFHGEMLESLDGGTAIPAPESSPPPQPARALDLAWVVVDRASVVPQPAPKAKGKDTRVRFQVVHVLEESGAYVRVGDGEWMLARDLARPHVVPPPAEVTGKSERWIDVELATQTLVAYEGARPVFATLVSTGRGALGSESATPPGVHRIWVKIFASDMDNVERDDLDAHYSLEDVPYVQFFDHAVGLHGTYWHHDFGHVKSHGCVNLAPLDARFLFDFTAPRLPTGWAAAYPSPAEPGTVVRVR